MRDTIHHFLGPDAASRIASCGILKLVRRAALRPPHPFPLPQNPLPGEPFGIANPSAAVFGGEGQKNRVARRGNLQWLRCEGVASKECVVNVSPRRAALRRDTITLPLAPQACRARHTT
jgi:hypothetical protein